MYGKDDALYPADIKTRALVDSRVQFDLGTLYARFYDYFVSVYILTTLVLGIVFLCIKETFLYIKWKWGIDFLSNSYVLFVL